MAVTVCRATLTMLLVNYVWDRVEKCIFLVVDLGLNIYFIRMVQNRLIANGLTKYNRLLRVNILMVVINISLDVRLFRLCAGCQRY